MDDKTISKKFDEVNSKIAFLNDNISASQSGNVNDGELTIQKNGVSVATFGANSSTNVVANIVVPTQSSDIGAVPNTRKINEKVLNNDVTLNQDDIEDGEDYVRTENNFSNSLKSNVENNTLSRHSHANKALLDTYDQTNTDLTSAVSLKHSHSNKAVLDDIDQSVVDNTHTHLNKTILDNTSESFTTALKGNIETNNSKVSNVQSDWNSTSGLSQILNKPTLAMVATSGSYNDLSNIPEDKIFWATYGTTTMSQIKVAVSAGKVVCCCYSGFIYYLVYCDTNYQEFQTIQNSGNNKQVRTLTIESGEWASNSVTLANLSDLPTVNNATITITQGGVTKGSFTTNQSSAQTIALDAGSGGSSTNIQVNGTSITNNNVANIITNGIYNESTNKIATMSDLSDRAKVDASNISVADWKDKCTFEQVDLLYDKDSSDSSINWGYTSGMGSGVSKTFDFSKYKYLRITATNYTTNITYFLNLKNKGLLSVYSGAGCLPNADTSGLGALIIFGKATVTSAKTSITVYSGFLRISNNSVVSTYSTIRIEGVY